MEANASIKVKDLSHYENAFNAGFDLGRLFSKDHRVLKGIEQFVEQHVKNVPEIIGIKDGYQEALLERKQQLQQNRAEELDNIHNNQLDVEPER